MIYFDKVYFGVLGFLVALGFGFGTQIWAFPPVRLVTPVIRHLYGIAALLAGCVGLLALIPRLKSSHSGCTEAETLLTNVFLHISKGMGYSVVFLTFQCTVPITDKILWRLFMALMALYALCAALYSAFTHSTYSRELVLCGPVQEYLSTTALVTTEIFLTVFMLVVSLWPLNSVLTWLGKKRCFTQWLAALTCIALKSVWVIQRRGEVTDLSHPISASFTSTMSPIEEGHRVSKTSSEIQVTQNRSGTDIIQPFGETPSNPVDTAELEQATSTPCGFTSARILTGIFGLLNMGVLMVHFLRFSTQMDVLAPWMTLSLTLAWSGTLLV
ncbi:hypothetical protein IWQ61_003415 [Dispira simplex]|nr:hypothetical protein IWQ61_003415 [Dispira simplex]